MSPTDQWVLTTLGEVYFRMGDLPEAGRVWFVTARSGPDWEAAQAAFFERYGSWAPGIVAALRVRGRIEDYPEPVQERLRNLQQRLKDKGRFWEPRPKVFRERPATPRWRKRLTGSLIAVAAILILLALGVGLYSMVRWLIAAGAG